MAKIIWTEQCERLWHCKEGTFSDLLDVLAIPAADRDLFCQLVGFPVYAEETADLLRQCGKVDSIPGFMNACVCAWETMEKAFFMARLWMLHEHRYKELNRCQVIMPASR